MTATRIGYIGLGAMGSALAGRLLGSHPLTVWDISRVAMGPFEQQGARLASTARELASHCDIVLLCLPRSSDVRKVIFESDGLADGLSAGTIVIDQTSGTPAQTTAMARELAQRGVAMLDAPVSGNPAAFGSGRGTVMVSGPDDVFDRAVSVLRDLSPTLLRCGRRLGDAQAMKLVNNTMNTGCRLATLEIAALGRKLGLSLQEIASALAIGAASNSTTHVMLPALLGGRSATDFALALMLKDLNQSLALAMEHGAPMPVASLARGLLQIGVNTLGEDARLDDVVRSIEVLAGTRIAGPATVSTHAAAPDVIGALPGALAACNAVVTLEAFALGLKFGLTLDDLRTVISASSGWSGALHGLWTGHGQDSRTALPPVAESLRDLQLACRAAIECGTPMQIPNAVRAIHEAFLQGSSDADADGTAIARWFETSATVRFDFQRPLIPSPVSPIHLAHHKGNQP